MADTKKILEDHRADLDTYLNEARETFSDEGTTTTNDR